MMIRMPWSRSGRYAEGSFASHLMAIQSKESTITPNPYPQPADGPGPGAFTILSDGVVIPFTRAADLDRIERGILAQLVEHPEGLHALEMHYHVRFARGVNRRLDRLERLGLVEGSWVYPDAKTYLRRWKVTDAGRRRLQQQ